MEEEFGEIVEPDNYPTEKQAFSHQSLVMTQLGRAMNLGSKELREGWWDEKIDKNGGVRRTYNEDTRKAFIESVKSLLLITECDFDDEAKKKIGELTQELIERRKFWLNEEWNWWTSLTLLQRQALAKEGKHVVKGMFNSKLQFDNYYFEDETNIYRRICTEVNNMAFRKDFYGEINWSA